MSVSTVSFWTDGKSYTNLLLEFYTSGEFDKFVKLLNGNGLNNEQIRKFFEFKFVLSGSTRDDDGMSLIFTDESQLDYIEKLYYGIKTIIPKNVNILDILSNEVNLNNKDIDVVFKYFTKDELIKIFSDFIITESGYQITTISESIIKSENSVSGVLLNDGRFIKCGYQDHINLFPLLKDLGLAKEDDMYSRHLSSNLITLSSNQLTGKKSHSLSSDSYLFIEENPEFYKISEVEVEELFKCKNSGICFYGERKNFTVSLLNYWSYFINKGSKYGNLNFLNKFYPNIRTCKILDNYENGKAFIRTSPLKSMPGLLNSIFVNNIEEYENAILEINKTFDKYKSVRFNNKINYFTQEFIEGVNGVANINFNSKGDNEIKLECSTDQGNIVKGIKGNYILDDNLDNELKTILNTLCNDFKCDIQIEFVIDNNNDLYVVQFRAFEDVVSEFYKDLSDTKGVLVEGDVFSKGSDYLSKTIKTSDILIVEQDCDSEKLINKKALIVENGRSFSHILALSKALNIPSIYNTGKVNLDGVDEVYFNTNYKNGFLTKQ